MTDVDDQADGAPLVAAFCARCPVVLPCLTAGRGARAFGVWGGMVLVDGSSPGMLGRGATERSGGAVTAALLDRLAVLVEEAGGRWAGTVGELAVALAELPGVSLAVLGRPSSLGAALRRAASQLAARG